MGVWRYTQRLCGASNVIHTEITRLRRHPPPTVFGGPPLHPQGTTWHSVTMPPFLPYMRPSGDVGAAPTEEDLRSASHRFFDPTINITTASPTPAGFPWVAVSAGAGLLVALVALLNYTEKKAVR